MKLLLNTYGCEYAFLDLDKALAKLILSRMVNFEALLKVEPALATMEYHGAEAIFLDGLGNEDLDALFDNGQDFVEVDEAKVTAENFEDLTARTECDCMVVCHQEVYWNCYQKHCDWQVETRPIPIDIVRKAAGVVGGRRGGVLMEYLVTWEVNVDAGSPKEAAEIAEGIMGDQVVGNTERGVFDVTDENGGTTCVDLAEEGQ